MASSTTSILHIILAVIIPPLPVALLKGIGKEFWICVVLTILGGVPGMIYALIVILAK